MNIKDIEKYLRFGFIQPYPNIKYDKVIYHNKDEIIENLNIILNNVMYKLNISDSSIFQSSGGFDSTLVLSYFKNVKTICSGPNNSPDIKNSILLSKILKNKHFIILENDLISSNIKDMLIDIHSNINKVPRGHINDIQKYSFLKFINNKFNVVIGGEGIELQYLGYFDIYKNIIEASIAYSDYNSKLAFSYINNKDYYKSNINFKNVLFYKKHKKINYLDIVNWWTTKFTQDDIKKLLSIELDRLPNLNLHDSIKWIFDFFGKEYYFDRLDDFSNHFNVKWITPLLDKSFIDYSLSIPVESRYCVPFTKYILYESFRHRMPSFVLKRKKHGLNVSSEFFNKKKNDIDLLIKEFLYDKSMKIYSYMDYNESIKQIESGFQKMWLLLNLSIWMEINE